MTDENDTVTTALPMPAAGPEMRMVEVALITASLTNPRKTFDQVKLGELAESIRASGVHQPVLLRPLPGTRIADTFDFRREGAPLPTYELVCGERRLRASRMAQAAEIPAMIRELTDAQVLEIQIIENLQRDDLSPLEEAEGYEKLMEHGHITADQVAEKVGKSRSYVYGRLKLLDLCHGAREALREGKLDASKALLIARIPDHKLQMEATEKITEENRWDGSIMSARAAAKMVQEEYMLRLDKAKFPISDIELVPAAGACGACPKRTGQQPELFADVKSADVCTDPTCYKAKEAAHNGRVIEAARAKGQTVIAAEESKELLHENGSYSDAKFKGYRRLDRVDDSPTDQPLRKILEKVMKAEGVTPIMIENPRKAGELEACLPNETVSRLLKLAEGQAQAAKAVSKEVREMVDAKKAKALAKAQAKYEVEWRRQLIGRCWEGMQKCTHALHTLEVHRYLALRTLHSLSTDEATAVCEVLGLGKVSPSQALRDHIKGAVSPDYVHLVMIAQHDSDPNDHGSRYDSRPANEGMHMVATSVFGESAQNILAEVQAAAAELHLPRPETAPSDAPEGTSTPPLAAHANDSARKSEKRNRPAAPAGDSVGERVSAAEAQANIAAALQAAEESNPGAAMAAQGNDPGPVADALGQDGGANQAGADVNTGATNEVAAGATVQVNDSVPKHQAKFIGKSGVVERAIGDGSCWWVVFSGKFKAQASFHVSELDVVAPPPAGSVPAAEQTDELPDGDGEDQSEDAGRQAAASVAQLEVGQAVKVKATAANRKWRGREVVLRSRKSKDPADTDPVWTVRFGTPPKHADCTFFSSDLEPVGQGGAL